MGSRPDAGRITDANAIKHDAAGGHTVVLGAARLPVTDAASAAALMSRASEARACEATAMNASSSRSHCVFMLYIAASHAATGTQLSGSLCLVDLAGRCDLVLGMSAERSVIPVTPPPHLHPLST